MYNKDFKKRAVFLTDRVGIPVEELDKLIEDSQKVILDYFIYQLSQKDLTSPEIFDVLREVRKKIKDG